MGDFFAGDSVIFSLVIIPLLIFLSRIVDQSIGTIRIICVSKGMKYISPLLGFVEVLLWIVIMGQIFQNLDNYLYYVAYAAGFGMGNYVGIVIEEKMAMGLTIVRVIPQRDSHLLTDFLREANFRCTTIKGHGVEGPVEIIFSVIKRKDINEFTCLIKKFNPKAFYTIEDVKFVNNEEMCTNLLKQDVFKIRKRYRQLRKSK